MPYTLNFGGSVNNTSGNTSYPNNYVYTDGFAFPTGNPDLNGNYVVELNSVSAAYATGASGIIARILRNGVESSGGGTRYAGGGVFRFLIRYTSGTLFFGRNTALGSVTRDAADGGSWNGPLVGSLTWSTSATAPRDLSVTRSGRDLRVRYIAPSSNGGATVTSYGLQYSTNGGSSWSSAVSDLNGDYTFTNMVPGRSYIIRVYAINAVGAGRAAVSGSVFVPAGGKRHTGSGWVNTTIARRHTGSGWTDLTIAKRHNGSTWVDLS